MKTTNVLIIFVIVGVLFISACSQQPQGQITTPTPTGDAVRVPTTTSPPSATIQPSTSGQTKEITVTGKNFLFDPSAITVKKGDHVKITFKNAEGFHDFKIDEFTVATKRIAGGQQDVVEFTADKTGTFEYYCSVGQHRAMGMKGTLIVEA